MSWYGSRAPDDKTYDWCHKFATANVVGDNVLFTATMLPVVNAANHDPDAYPVRTARIKLAVSSAIVDIVERRADLSVRRVFADREFHAVDVVAALEERDIFYVIPAARDARVKRFIARMGENVTVKDVYVMHGPVKDSVSNTPVETTLVGLPPDEDRDECQTFLTNLAVNDEIGLDRRQTQKRIKRYTRRGGIETAYSKIKEFAPWTTSTAFSVRLFHFGFAVLLYDMWLLVDFLVQVSLGIVEFRPKPRVTAPRFRGFLRRRVITLL